MRGPGKAGAGGRPRAEGRDAEGELAGGIVHCMQAALTSLVLHGARFNFVAGASQGCWGGGDGRGSGKLGRRAHQEYGDADGGRQGR